MARVECPYCEEFVDICTDDHYDGYCEYECPLCEKNFEVLAEPTTTYSSCVIADCLNGGEHEWKNTVGFPEIHFRGYYHCKNCSAEKIVKEELPTNQEWDEYFKND